MFLILLLILSSSIIEAKLWGPVKGYFVTSNTTPFTNGSIFEKPLINFVIYSPGYSSPIYHCSYVRDLKIWGNKPYPLSSSP